MSPQSIEEIEKKLQNDFGFHGFALSKCHYNGDESFVLTLKVISILKSCLGRIFSACASNF